MLRLIPQNLRADPGYGVAALLPLIGILPTLGAGVIRTADGPLHVQRIYAMALLLAEGQLWPRWVPYFHLGYGYPVFNFYPPGVFQLGGYLVRLGLDAAAAFTLLAALAWIIGSVGTYGLARRFLPGVTSLLAAALWAYAPSRLVEVWDQGSLPQIRAAAFVPWLLWALLNAAASPSARRAALVALPMAGIILCHQPITFISALYAGPLALLLSLWHARRAGRFWARALAAVGGLALAGGLAAIFLLPLAFELRHVAAAQNPEDTVPYLISNFLRPAEVFMQPPAMDLTDLRFELQPTLGLIPGLLAGAGLIALAWRRRFAAAALLALGIGFTVFMLLLPSLPLWLAIPYFAQLRFPERFLRVGAVLIGLAGGAALLLIPPRWRSAGLAAGLVVVIAAALPLIYPNQTFVTWDNLSAVDAIQMELDEQVWGTTSYNEFNPRWGREIRYDPPEIEAYEEMPLRLTVYRLDAIRQWPALQFDERDANTIHITLTEPRTVRFRQYYFPGWVALRDGEPFPIYPDDEVGLIALDLPAGEHTIELFYAGTPVQHLAGLITLAALLVTGAMLWRGGVAADPPPADPPPARAALIAGAGIIGFALINTLWIAPETLLFRHRSPPDAPVAMQTRVDVPFGDSFMLLGYMLPAESAAPGRPLDVMLFWRALRPVAVDYRPVVQLVDLNVSEAWAVSQPLLPGGGHTSRGYPLDRFASEIHTLDLFPQAQPYVARVMVQMVEARTGEPLRLPDGADRLLLDPLIRVEGPTVPPADQPLADAVDEVAVLVCASAVRAADVVMVNLHWHVTNPAPGALRVFVHGLDDDGAIIAQADGPPLAGRYPPSLWLPGQYLRDAFTLPADPALASVAVGFYLPDGPRLPITRAGEPLPGDQITLALDSGPGCE